MNKTKSTDFTVAEIRLSYNPIIKAGDRLKITKPLDVYNAFLTSWDKDKLQLVEQFKMMLLNPANHVMGIVEISSGGIAGTVVDARLIFGVALKAAATRIILAHNHPSGNVQPSDLDKRLTQTIKSGADILDIKLLDHMIITAHGYSSFSDMGLL